MACGVGVLFVCHLIRSSQVEPRRLARIGDTELYKEEGVYLKVGGLKSCTEYVHHSVVKHFMAGMTNLLKLSEVLNRFLSLEKV